MAEQQEMNMDQSLNIGSTIRLAEGLEKTLKIGNIALIRQVRQTVKDIKLNFSYCIGRGTVTLIDGEVDAQKEEEIHRQSFDLIFTEKLTDEEYERVDMDGIKALEEAVARFL